MFYIKLADILLNQGPLRGDGSVGGPEVKLFKTTWKSQSHIKQPASSKV